MNMKSERRELENFCIYMTTLQEPTNPSCEVPVKCPIYDHANRSCVKKVMGICSFISEDYPDKDIAVAYQHMTAYKTEHKLPKNIKVEKLGPEWY